EAPAPLTPPVQAPPLAASKRSPDDQAQTGMPPSPEPIGPSDCGGLALDELILSERLPDPRGLGASAAAAHVESTLDHKPRDLFEALPAEGPCALSSPLLGALDNAVLQKLLDQASMERYAGGEIVFRQGAAGDALYVIVSGALEVVREEPGQSEQNR